MQDQLAQMEAFTTQSVRHEVVRYIKSHLCGDLSLEALSRRTGYSVFHLHRMLKEELNESVGSYIKRKRMETAAFLLSLTNLPISEIAYWVGYNSDPAFSKAFRQVMKSTARDFRKKGTFASAASELPKEYVSYEYQVIKLNEWKGIAFPGMFNYFDRSLFNCWNPVADWLQKTQIRRDGLQYWGVLYECPNVTGNLHARVDAVVTTQGAPESILFDARYPGGKYARFHLCAPQDMISAITKNISAYMLYETTMELRDGYSYMRYLQDPMIHEPDYLTTEWYVPIK